MSSVFSCPKCAGSYFGTQNPGERDRSKWVRQCHDQFGIGCRWSGIDAECMVSREDAYDRIRGGVDSAVKVYQRKLFEARTVKP
jgi:hypothetical protein